jgi:hypothetical protein
MPTFEKDRLAADVAERWTAFQAALFEKREYPIREFELFADRVRRYAEATKADALIHRSVVEAVHGLTDFLSSERKRVPEDVMRHAEQLECLLFSGYDPHFGGDEPPGL